MEESEIVLLRRKAEEFGDDADEAVMVAKAELAKAKKASASPLPQVFAPKSVKEKAGNIRTCPACGAEAQPFQTKCPVCGHEFSNVEVTESIAKFAAELKRLDGHEVERGNTVKLFVWAIVVYFGIIIIHALLGGYDSMFWGTIIAAPFSIILILVAIFKKPATSRYEDQKMALVKNFIVPNTREAIFEFFTFASTQIVKVSAFLAVFSLEKKYQQIWNKTWRAKCHQTYLKAKLSLGQDDPKTFNAITEMYLPIQKSHTKSLIAGIVTIVILAAGVFIGIAMYRGSFIEVPKEKVFAENEVVFSEGAFDKCFTITDAVMKSTVQDNKNQANAVLTITVKKTAKTSTVIDTAINKELKNQGWSRNGCTIKEFYLCYIRIFGENRILNGNEHSSDYAPFFKELVDMEVGTSSKFIVPAGIWGTRKDIKELMEAPNLSLKVDLEITYRIEHRSDGKSEYVNIN